MSEYIKISDVIKICKHLYSSFGTTAFFDTHVLAFENLLRTVAVEFPEPPKHETTTFKPIATDTRGYACQFSCNACDCTVSRAYYMRPDQFDYAYCPYCGKPVESEDVE
jgi:hypothetical protein